LRFGNNLGLGLRLSLVDQDVIGGGLGLSEFRCACSSPTGSGFGCATENGSVAGWSWSDTSVLSSMVRVVLVWVFVRLVVVHVRGLVSRRRIRLPE
jgi:hypothetical protein